MHGEEAGAREERARDEEDARVVVAPRGPGDQRADDGGDHGRGEHEREVRVVVLPAQVGAGLFDQEPETEDGQGEVQHPDRGPQRGGPADGEPRGSRGPAGPACARP